MTLRASPDAWSGILNDTLALLDTQYHRFVSWPGGVQEAAAYATSRALPAGLPGLLPRRQLSYPAQLVVEEPDLEPGSVLNSYSVHPRCRAPPRRSAHCTLCRTALSLSLS